MNLCAIGLISFGMCLAIGTAFGLPTAVSLIRDFKDPVGWACPIMIGIGILSTIAGVILA